MIRALSTDANVDLRPFLALLREQHLRFQVTEESGRLVLWAATDGEAEHINGLYDQWRSGELVPEHSSTLDQEFLVGQSAKGLANGFLRSVHYAPVSIIFIAACLLVATLSQLGAELEPVRHLFFPDFAITGDNRVTGLFASISSVGDVVRMFTPALLHFGIIHLVFNLLWLWYFGRMIEASQPSGRFLLLVLFTAFWANVTQYLWSGQTNFGGMSGVVYGLIGYIWMWQTLLPRTALYLPPAMIAVFLVALVLMEVVAASWIATAAHVGGLVSGMLAGFLVALFSRSRSTGRS